MNGQLGTTTLGGWMAREADEFESVESNKLGGKHNSNRDDSS